MPGSRAEARAALLLALALVAPANGAAAHPLAPALLELEESRPGVVDVRFRTSLYRSPGSALVARLPDHCRPLSPRTVREVGGGLEERWRADCGGVGLVGSTLGVSGLAENGIDALVRIGLADGRRFGHVLRADASAFVVPERPSRWHVLSSYLALGVQHIWSGADHLLFLLGLLLLASSLRSLLWTLTAFTLGHCVTLTAAALGWLRLPATAVEPLIAASILVLAVRLARLPPASEAARAAPGLSFGLTAAFGLLHGSGFAGALVQAGLPPGEIPLALLGFNLGIETGQALFVLALWLLARALASPLARLPFALHRIPVYAMGAAAGFWLIERTAVLLP